MSMGGTEAAFMLSERSPCLDLAVVRQTAGTPEHEEDRWSQE